MNQPATCSQKSKGKRFTNTIFSNIFLSTAPGFGRIFCFLLVRSTTEHHTTCWGVSYSWICHDAWKKFRKMFRFRKNGSLVAMNPMVLEIRKNITKKTQYFDEKCPPPKRCKPAFSIFGKNTSLLTWLGVNTKNWSNTQRKGQGLPW